MTNITIQKPTDQPTGSYRLMDEFRSNLEDNEFHTFRIIVAFAKEGPLLRLDNLIRKWRTANKNIQAIIGIDQKGTSQQALDYALNNFNTTYIAHTAGNFSPTFHPKVYLFIGDQKALAYIGSNNLTVGGTETNLEAHIKLEVSLPSDKTLLQNVLLIWDDALKVSRLLDNELLSHLISSGLVLDERQMRQARNVAVRDLASKSPEETRIPIPEFPFLQVRPPSPLPKSPSAKSTQPKKSERTEVRPSTLPDSPAETLVIQISPHHNGEVFLSKTAVNQNPKFFGFPFTGLTTPKISTNPAYPQRIPDPIVNLVVYDIHGRVLVAHSGYNLNTVYYDTKSEIRITVPQDVVGNTPPFSIMVMRQASPDELHDYDIDVYPTGSQQYDEYLAVCNQTMPSGGKTDARKFGWL